MLEGGAGVLYFCWSVAQLILGRFPGWAWRGRAGVLALLGHVGQSVGFA